VDTQAYKQISKQASKQTHTHIHTHSRTHTYTHTLTHTNTHTHTHTTACSFFRHLQTLGKIFSIILNTTPYVWLKRVLQTTKQLNAYFYPE
jgi:hypothetical protein